MTLEQYINQTLTEKDYENLSTNVITGQKMDVPELKALKAKAAPPPPPPAPEPEPEKPFDYEAFQKLSPQDRIRLQNPGATPSELAQMFAQMLPPQPTFESLVIQNTKVKRKPKAADGR